MAWTIAFERSAEKDLTGLGHAAASRILIFLRNRVSQLDDRQMFGEALKGSNLGTFWNYRVGDDRVIASIEGHAVRMVVVRSGHRREVYP